MQQDGAEHDRNRSAFFCGWGINVGQGRRFGLGRFRGECDLNQCRYDDDEEGLHGDFSRN